MLDLNQVATFGQIHIQEFFFASVVTKQKLCILPRQPAVTGGLGRGPVAVGGLSDLLEVR